MHIEVIDEATVLVMHRISSMFLPQCRSVTLLKECKGGGALATVKLRSNLKHLSHVSIELSQKFLVSSRSKCSNDHGNFDGIT